MDQRLPDLVFRHLGEDEIRSQTESLLAGRTRDIRLTGGMLQLYLQSSWAQRSKVMQAWAVWVTLINLIFIPASYLLIPDIFPLSVQVGLLVVPPVHAALYLIWMKQRSAFVEGLSALLVVCVFMSTFGFLGAASGGLNAERFITGALFFAVVAIKVFGVQLVWSGLIAASAMAIYCAFQIASPTNSLSAAIGSSIYFGMGMFAVVVARRTDLILDQKSFLMSLRDGYRRKDLTLANELLEALATRDPLTSLANRRYAADRIEKIWRDPSIDKGRVAFIMADIDRFKLLNDTAGHAAGDDCILRVAHAIEASAGPATLVCRYGGEEFLVVLTDVTVDAAWAFAERIRRDVENLRIANPGLSGASITISLGVAFATSTATAELVAKQADDALYDAKRTGRNRAFLTAAGSAAPAASAQVPGAAALAPLN